MTTPSPLGPKRRRFLETLAAVSAAGFGDTAYAQSDKVLRIILPNATGSGIDAITRAAQDVLGKAFPRWHARRPTAALSASSRTTSSLSRANVQGIHDGVVAAFAAPEVRDMMARQGNVIDIGTPEQAQAFFRSEMTRFAALVKKAGIELQ